LGTQDTNNIMLIIRCLQEKFVNTNLSLRKFDFFKSAANEFLSVPFFFPLVQ
jgi:hypothetical protein